MRRTRRVAGLFGGVAALTAMALVGPQATAISAHQAVSKDGGQKATSGTRGDLRATGSDFNHGKKLPLDKQSLATAKKRIAQQNARAANGDFEKGDQLDWLALDDRSGRIYLKPYTLRGLGDHIQVWVANDTTFPAGDCRNTLGLTDITDAQVDNFVSEFDTNIYPKESASFSVPPSLDGANSPLGQQLGDPDRYKTSADQADDISVLVDNVRDDNYSAPGTPNGQTYIAGFFYSVFNDLVNRNVMTIDAFDWLHRTGANPPDNSADADYIACAQSQGVPANRAYGAPRPRLYEGTFAHEYQHLLESYEDPDEVSWVNEGLSDYAQSLVGYVDTSKAPDSPGADNHIGSFLGFFGQAFGGPENSLTEWEDQGPPEILADYGAAYSMMMYLFDKYGEKFMSALHREDAGGLPGLDKVLKRFGSPKNAQQTLNDWAALVSVDDALNTSNGTLVGDGEKKWLTAKSLDGKVNWSNPQAYDTAGAPPNGSDYVRARDADGNFLRLDQINKIQFEGSKGLPPEPVEWTVANTPPNATTADTTCGAVETGDQGAALYSGCGSNLDRSIVRQVTVPATGDATMAFKTLYDTEEGWDFGFLQVSTDGGKTYQSVATQDTTDSHDPGADPAIVANMPGFTGDSGTWKTESADLSQYAGKQILVGFRYMTDGGVDEGGFWVKDISLGGTAIPTSLDGWQTITQINPVKVNGYTVQVVAYDAKHRVLLKRLKPDTSFKVTSGKITGIPSGPNNATVVGILVMQKDPGESAGKQATYKLYVNGVLQPGGDS